VRRHPLISLALLTASPSFAQDAPPLAPPTVAQPVDLGIEAFYNARNGAPLWLKDESSRAAAVSLAALVRVSAIDGVTDAVGLADRVDAAIKSGTPADDRIISQAWLAYARALTAPVPEVGYGDPLRKLLPQSAVAILHAAAQAPSLIAHVDQVAAVNPIYASLRSAALSANSAENPQVAESLRRLRLIPASGRAILVDISAAQLMMLEDGKVVDSMKVVVGKSGSPTPELAGTIHYVTFNPYWHILDEVVQRKVAPVVLKRGVSYLKAARYETVSDWMTSEPVDPATIDWKAVKEGTKQVFIRQRPGTNNMMGAMKFSFENDQDIFLHDTPHRELFAKAKRNYSLGCVRLERAADLARWLLKGDLPPPGDTAEHHQQLIEGVPVYLLNLPAMVRDGQLAFADGPVPQLKLAAAASDTIAH
jgi:murein L,D-transpeptidase YcbB/YkuD